MTKGNNMTTSTKIYGHKALAVAERTGSQLWMHTSPTEDGGKIDAVKARAVLADDPSLVYTVVEVQS